MQKITAQEKEDESMEVVKNSKSQKGRKQQVKVKMFDIKPSPYGRRVEPRIDPALKAKSAAEARKKIKQAVSDI